MNSLTGCTDLFNYLEIITYKYLHQNVNVNICKPGRVAQLVMCLATDAYLTKSRGCKLIPAQSHTFMDIGHEIISTFILLPSADSFKKGCCQLQAKVCAQSTG